MKLVICVSPPDTEVPPSEWLASAPTLDDCPELAMVLALRIWAKLGAPVRRWLGLPCAKAPIAPGAACS